MKVNNYLDNSEAIYKYFTFADFSFEKYQEIFKIYEEINDPREVLIKIGLCEGFVHQFLKTMSITTNYLFNNKKHKEQERLSLEFMILFSMTGNDKDFKKERVRLVKTILAGNCKLTSNFEVSIVEVISSLYLIYCICETFIGTTVIFFSFFPNIEDILKSNKFECFYSEFVKDDQVLKLDDEEYEMTQYKELLLKYLGKDNSSQLFKLLIEYFAGAKLDMDSIDEENVEEIILTSVKERFLIFDYINFEKLLDAIPLLWSTKANLVFLLV
jgi:hypothetical protein